MQSSHSRKSLSMDHPPAGPPSSSLTLSKAGLCVLLAQKPSSLWPMQRLWTLAALKGFQPSGRR